MILEKLKQIENIAKELKEYKLEDKEDYIKIFERFEETDKKVSFFKDDNFNFIERIFEKVIREKIVSKKRIDILGDEDFGSERVGVNKNGLCYFYRNNPHSYKIYGSKIVKYADLFYKNFDKLKLFIVVNGNEEDIRELLKFITENKEKINELRDLSYNNNKFKDVIINHLSFNKSLSLINVDNRVKSLIEEKETLLIRKKQRYKIELDNNYNVDKSNRYIKMKISDIRSSWRDYDFYISRESLDDDISVKYLLNTIGELKIKLNESAEKYDNNIIKFSKQFDDYLKVYEIFKDNFNKYIIADAI